MTPGRRSSSTYDEVVRSSLAANAADQCSLGHCRRGYKLIAKRHFRRRVKRDMAKLGYDR